MLNGTQAQIQAELERKRAAQRANYVQRKERLLNNTEYREQELQRRKGKRYQKRKAIEEEPFHVDARNDGTERTMGAKRRRV